MVVKTKLILLAMFFLSMLLQGGENKPDGAIQLIGPEGISHLIAEKGGGELPWPFKDGVLAVAPESRTSAITDFPLGDFKAHLEFRVFEKEGVSGNNGNSGVYIQQSYEIQILNSFERKDKYTYTDCASIYKFKMPDELVCKPAGEWQSYDIDFKAARWDADKKIANAVLSLIHNGVLVHDKVELLAQTGRGRVEAPGLRPLRLQNHGNPVEFRNFWIKSDSLAKATSQNKTNKSQKKKGSATPVTAAIAEAKPSKGETLFKANCIACHQPVDAIVGPSLAEIAEIYRGNTEGLVKWAVKPGYKRKTGIPMQSMAFIGDEKLGLIADYMIKEGKKHKQAKKSKRPQFMEKLGKIQRVFMPNSGPASIAVKLPNGISYCWDAGRCQLRYFWEGELIPGRHFVSNGNSLPKLSNPAFYSTNISPFAADLGEQDFLGYDLNDKGLPVFEYRLGDYKIKETLDADKDDISWNYSIEGDQGIVYQLPQVTGYQVSTSVGKVTTNQLTLSKSEMKQFTISLKKTGGK